MTQLPSAIVMLVKDRAFMTVRDFEAADGSPPTGQDGKPPSRADGKPARGIAPLSDKFGLDATIDVWAIWFWLAKPMIRVNAKTAC